MTHTSVTDLGRAVRDLRIERRLSGGALATVTGIELSYLSHLERGLTNPLWPTLRALAEAFEIPVSDLARVADGRRILAEARATVSPPVSVGRAVRRLRRAQGIEMNAVALAVGSNVSHLSAVERGITSLSWTTLGEIASALETQPASLIEQAETEPRFEPPPQCAPFSPRSAAAEQLRDRHGVSLGAPGTLALGQAIRWRRVGCQMTRAAFALRAHTDRGYLKQIESGRTKLGWAKLGALAGALDLRVSELARAAELQARGLLQGAAPSVIAVGGLAHNPPTSAALGKALRRLRNSRAMTIEGLAEMTGLHYTAVYKIEHDERRPSWPILCVLATGVGLSVSALVLEAEAEHRGHDGWAESRRAVGRSR